MPVKDLVRDAAMGQLIRWVTKNRYLQYPEEKPGFKFPDCWVDLMNNPDRPLPESSETVDEGGSSDSRTLGEERKPRPDSEGQGSNGSDEKPTTSNQDKQEESGGSTASPERPSRPSRRQSRRESQQTLQRTATGQSSREWNEQRFEDEEAHNMERTKSLPVVPKRTRDGAILVDWYYSDDPENPYNWSRGKRLAVTSIICFYTFVVYTSSAIYTTSEPGVQQAFHVSEIKATLGLSLYVLGYGVGPLIFSPLSEIPRIGRNPVYVATMWIFVILTIPTAFAQNFAGLMVLRFLTGFFGSPCLASGGASIGDMYSLLSLPYAMMAWVAAAYCGREYTQPFFYSFFSLFAPPDLARIY
jgi:DHA1 family multidrug resistance protein-like MFS transporter